MKICNIESCTGCGACVQSCPIGCIEMIEDKEGFIYPSIDEKRCVQCRRCKNVCHINQEYNHTHEPDFFMATHKNDDVLKKSSSGGAFTALAEYVLRKKGIVYGASFSKATGSVVHVAIEDSDCLDMIRLSKYFQGTINECYKDVKKNLETRLVLFSGTACQIAGLYCFLGKNNDNTNLITVDVLCHGVTSKKVVESYIKCKERKYKKKVVNYRFRLKPDDSDWINGGGTRIRLDFEDNTSKVQSKDFDTFFVGFNKYLFLRKSCYICKYSGTNRISDFTLADYWGVPEKTITDRERRYGVSLVLCNSQKSRKIINCLMKEVDIKKINPERAIACNQALRSPSTSNPHRNNFFKELNTKNFDWLVYKTYRKYYIKSIAKQLFTKVLGEERYIIWRKMIKT